METWKVFGAPWCKYCSPVLEAAKRISKDLPVELEYFDVSDEGNGRHEGWKYHVMSLPMWVIMEDDVPIRSASGTAIIDRMRERREELERGED